MNEIQDEKKPQLIELTAKKYKRLQLIGNLILAAGAISIIGIGVITGQSTAGLWFGLPICAVGVIVHLWGSTLAWWHHG